MQESDGIKAYRQASAVPASTTSDVLGPVLSASSFTDKPASSTELQIQPTAIESAQSAPRLVTAGIEKSKKLPTVPLSQVPLNIQQILAFAPVQSEPAVSYEATLAASAATETLQTHDASQIPAQDQAMALRSLQGSMNGQSQQHVELDSATMANQSQQSMAAVKSASNVLPPDSMTRMEEAQTSHTGRVRMQGCTCCVAVAHCCMRAKCATTRDHLKDCCMKCLCTPYQVSSKGVMEASCG